MAYPGFQRGGHLRSGPIRKVGGGGASPLQVRYTKSGEGGNSLRVQYEKWGRAGEGGGGHSASGPIPLFGTQIIYTCTYLRAT